MLRDAAAMLQLLGLKMIAVRMTRSVIDKVVRRRDIRFIKEMIVNEWGERRKMRLEIWILYVRTGRIRRQGLIGKASRNCHHQSALCGNIPRPKWWKIKTSDK
jgi:hypothetical protein